MKGRTAILVHRDDNVVTLAEDVALGERVTYRVGDGSESIRASRRIPFGHKVARRDMAQGDKVVKYGQVIGLASQPIRRGDHVHVHNVRSGVQGAKS